MGVFGGLVEDVHKTPLLRMRAFKYAALRRPGGLLHREQDSQ